MTPFTFEENLNEDKPKHIFLGSLSPGIKNKDDLLKELSLKLHFPQYFGFNWDALSECLQDLQWIKEKDVVILHNDLPNLPDKELYLYLDILRYCINDWEKYEGPYHKHDLHVIFPSITKQKIEKLFKK